MMKPIKQKKLIATQEELELIQRSVYGHLHRAEMLYPGWPVDLLIGDQVVNEEKGEATKALLDVLQKDASITDAIDEYHQTIAMCMRQIIAIYRQEGVTPIPKPKPRPAWDQMSLDLNADDPPN